MFAEEGYLAMMGQLWQEYMSRGNFHPMIDADQLLRVILTFLNQHQEFKNREIVMVGESYGGVRVSTILHMLMNSGMYDDGGDSFFQDPGLAKMVRDYFDTEQTAPTPEQVSAVFDRQILVQPQLSSYQGTVQGEMYWDKRWSIIDWIAEDSRDPGGFTRDVDFCKKNMTLGFLTWTKGTCPIMAYLPKWNRDRYDYGQPSDYSDKHEAYVNEAMRSVPILTAMLGVDPTKIEGLKPADRKNAYHTIGWPMIGRDSIWTWNTKVLAGALGNVNAPDTYYLSWNQYAYVAGAVNLGSLTKFLLPLSPDKDPLYGQMFLQNLRHVQTFLTDAKRDLVIYSPALPEALRRHTDLVTDVAEHPQDPSQPGELVVSFKDGSTTNIRWPFYADAGHAVAMTQPDKLLQDVTAWMTGDASIAPYARWTVGKARLARWNAHGVRVTAGHPAAKVGGALLMSLKSDPAGQLRGTVRFRHEGSQVVLRSMTLGKSAVTVTVKGNRVRILSLRGQGTARLTRSGAKALNAGMGMDVFRAGQPMGQFAER